MAVSTTGDVYSWGKTVGGRIGLKTDELMVSTPQKVPVKDANNRNVKAVDVECGYVHSMIIGCDGSLYMCGGVGTDDNEDGQNQEEILDGSTPGEFRNMPYLIVNAHGYMCMDYVYIYIYLYICIACMFCIWYE